MSDREALGFTERELYLGKRKVQNQRVFKGYLILFRFKRAAEIYSSDQQHFIRQTECNAGSTAMGSVIYLAANISANKISLTQGQLFLIFLHLCVVPLLMPTFSFSFGFSLFQES